MRRGPEPGLQEATVGDQGGRVDPDDGVQHRSMVDPSRSSWSTSSISEVLPFSTGRESAHWRGSRV